MNAKSHTSTYGLQSTTFDDRNEPGVEKHHATLENSDYTGAEAKTDPAEIALVRKIDWRLMVCYGGTPNRSTYLIIFIADIVYHVFLELRRQKRNCTSTIK